MKDITSTFRPFAASALLGLISGALSSATMLLRVPGLNGSPVDWLPGLVFGFSVILPLSLRIHDPWLRTAAAIVVSSVVYPIAHRVAADSAIDHSTGYIVAAVAFSGLLGSSALAGAFLAGRPRWASSAAWTISVGTLFGAASGASLLLPSYHPSIGFRLAVILIVWQTAVAASLGRGTLTMPNKPDGANRRQPPGFRKFRGTSSVLAFTAAVAHPRR